MARLSPLARYAVPALSGLVLAAGLVAAPATTATAAPAGTSAINCDLWRSSGAGLTGYALCRELNGYPRFQVKVTCNNRTTVRSPIVRIGQTTWATCSSTAGGVIQHDVLGYN